jgi:hypothetical protein
MTPLRSIRAFCVECVGSSHLAADCGGDKMIGSLCGKNETCYFFPFRMGAGRPSVKTIRQFCLQCMGGQPSLVRECTSTTCQVWSYRMGKNPKRAGIGDAERLKKPVKGPDRRFLSKISL